MRTDRLLRRALLAAAAAGTSLALLGACAGSSGGPDPAPSPSGTLSDNVLKAVLLTGKEIGGDFRSAPVPDSQPLPCAPPGSGTLDEQSPPAVQANTVLLSQSLRGQVGERIKVYANPDAASAALAIYVAGFGCPTGTLRADDGKTSPLTIAGPSDVTAQVAVAGVDGVAGWEISSPEFDGLAIAAQYGATLLFLTFANPVGADPASYPDSLQVIKAALTKLVNS